MAIVVTILFFTLPVVSKESASEENNSEEVGVKMAVDLKATGEYAKKKNIPIMIFFAAEDCVYCERLEADYLHAMANSAEYRNKVVIRKVVIDSYDDFRDFKGKTVEASDYSDDFDIQVTPTLVFLNHKGERVGKRIFGYNASGFFGSELDEFIDNATIKLK